MLARLVVVVGLVALLGGVALAGAHSGHRQLGSNYTSGDVFAVALEGGQRVCQRADIVQGTSGLRFTMGTYGRPGPPLAARVSAEGRTVSSGRLAGGWGEGEAVVIPVQEISEPLVGARVCVSNEGDDRIAVAGATVDPTVGARVDGERTPAAVRIEYTDADKRSWWSMLGTIADRMGAVRVAFPGAATMWLWLGLLAVVVAGVVALLLQRPRRVGRVVAVLALANGLAWSLVIAPWHVPDEYGHVYYAAYLAQTGELPVAREGVEWLSPQMREVLTIQRFPLVVGRSNERPAWTQADADAVRAAEHGEFDDVGDGHASTATSNPPGYYLLQAAAYKLSPSSDLMQRLALMRLLAVVISALTVAVTYAFVREVLPRRPFVAMVGALAAALQPLFGFISSGVNNDGLLYLFSALLLFGIARAFRRGLTPRRAALIGGTLAVGMLVKAQLIAYAPAVAVAFVLLLARARAWRVQSVAAAGVAAVVPLAVYFVLGRTVWARPVIDRVGEVADTPTPTFTGMVSYVWQEYLPRLPFMQDWFGGFALKSLWVDGLLGDNFGWLDYSFPGWVLTLGALAVTLITAATIATLIRHRPVLRRRRGEAIVYALVALGLAGAVAVTSYLKRLEGETFEQARYLLPLLPLYALAVALAVQVFGRRWVPLLGSLVVLATLAHTVFAQLLTMTRYYG